MARLVRSTGVQKRTFHEWRCVHIYATQRPSILMRQLVRSDVVVLGWTLELTRAQEKDESDV